MEKKTYMCIYIVWILKDLLGIATPFHFKISPTLTLMLLPEEAWDPACRMRKSDPCEDANNQNMSWDL